MSLVEMKLSYYFLLELRFSVVTFEFAKGFGKLGHSKW